MQRIFIQRKLFSEDPKRRFSRVFKCSGDVWAEVWRRYKFLDYSEEEARQYLIFVLRIDIPAWRFKRWIMRTEAYNKAQIALKRGTQEVTGDYFGKLKGFVEREITKNL